MLYTEKNTQTPNTAGVNFLKQNQGGLTISKTENGATHIAFNSTTTGRTAFAYGKDFIRAYKKMVHLYNLKYA